MSNCFCNCSCSWLNKKKESSVCDFFFRRQTPYLTFAKWKFNLYLSTFSRCARLLSLKHSQMLHVWSWRVLREIAGKALRCLRSTICRAFEADKWHFKPVAQSEYRLTLSLCRCSTLSKTFNTLSRPKSL